MKIVRKIIALILVALTAGSCTLLTHANEIVRVAPESLANKAPLINNNLKIASISQVLRKQNLPKEQDLIKFEQKNETASQAPESLTDESSILDVNPKLSTVSKLLRDQKTLQKDSSLIKMVYFDNNIPEFLGLDSEFNQNPQRLKNFLDHFDFMINDQVIPINEFKAIAIRKDKPFTFRIKAKPLESLLACVKTSTREWLKFFYNKGVNLFTLNILYGCSVHESTIHNDAIIRMDELVYGHPVMVEILKNPSNIMNKIKPYLKWSEWFGLEVKLPDLEVNS